MQHSRIVRSHYFTKARTVAFFVVLCLFQMRLTSQQTAAAFLQGTSEGMPQNTQEPIDSAPEGDSASEHTYNSHAFYDHMLKPDRLKNHIVYIPKSTFDTSKLHESILVVDSELTEHDRLHKRDSAIEKLDAPTIPRRVVRAVAGCSSATTFALSPLAVEEAGLLTLEIKNLPAVGADFGNGVPQFYAFFNASILDIKNGQTTTLTVVKDAPVETSGVGFQGCFTSTKITNQISATLTQAGAKITPNVTDRYFVEITASPGAASTRIGFQITETPYTHTPSPTTGTGSTTLPPTPPLPTKAIPIPTPRDCPGSLAFTATTTGAAVYSSAKAGAALTVTLSGVKESIVSSTAGMKATTWEARYKAGEIVTVSYTPTVSGGATISDVLHPISKTLAPGKTVTYRRVVTTTLQGKDGCLDNLVDSKNWVVPKKLDDGVRVLNIYATVGDTKAAGVALLAGVSTSIIPPYPTDTPIPPKPTTIVNTATACEDFYAAITPSAVTPGATITVQLYNLPATPVKLISSGWSTVYEATYAPTILSNQVAITAFPSATYRTTVFKPTCITATVTAVATAMRKYLPVTAAPSPTPVYEVLVRAKNYSNVPDGILPVDQRQVETQAPLYLIRGPTTPESLVIKEHPCLVGPITVKTKITYDVTRNLSRFYNLDFLRYKPTKIGQAAKDADRKMDMQRLAIADAADRSAAARLKARAPAASTKKVATTTRRKIPTTKKLTTKKGTPKPTALPSTPLKPGEVDLTTLTLRLGTSGSGTVQFNFRDRIDTGKLDLYMEDLKTLPMPTDWSVAYTPTGRLLGRVMPPFTITTTYSINSAFFENGTVAPGIKPKIVLVHNVTVRPWWGASESRFANIPNTPFPTVRFNVTSVAYGELDNLKMTCAHPYAKQSAFSVMVFGNVLSRNINADMLSELVTQKTTWTLNTTKSGSFVPASRPVLLPRNLGPISEIMERYAIDHDSTGRNGGKNPNALPGSPTQKEILDDLAQFRSA